MKKIKNIFILFLSISLITACDLDLQQDPNELSNDQVDVDFLLNSIIVAAPIYNYETGKYGSLLAQNTNINENRANTYIGAMQGQDFNDGIEVAYAGILNDAKTLLPLAEARGFNIHSGIVKVMQAWVLVTLVDLYGDMPWSEALDPTNFNPVADPGADIYAAADAMLVAAQADFAAGGPVPGGDLFFGGDTDSWISVAKTLQFRNAVATRQVNANSASIINTLITDGDLMDDNGLDFAFPHSSVAANPDSRAKYFIDNYITGASDYQANHMLWAMYQEKSVVDPRIRYYFYRQTLTPTTDVNELNCLNAPFPSHFGANQPYCHLTDGYWGRDFLVTRGIPPDNLLRTNFGIYPAGGRFDDETGQAVLATDGAQGAGIEPFFMAHYVPFLKAEAALTLGTTGDPRTLLETGVRASISAVMAFGAANEPNYPDMTAMVEPDGSPGDVPPTGDEITAAEFFGVDQGSIDAYVAEVLARYDAATNDDERLDIMQQEYQIAVFGNGHEAYSAYRRNGFPNTSYMQPSESASPGDYLRSLLYSDNIASRNSSIDQKTTTTVQVFWDQTPQSRFIQ